MSRRAEEARKSLESARERTEGLPQYEGKFEDWVPVRVTREVRTKMGLAFERGEIAIAAPRSRNYDGWTERTRTVWSRRNEIQTTVRSTAVEDLELEEGS